MIWVAEIGSAHNGSKAQAFEMIRQAKLHGATIAKFQFWNDEAQMKYAGDINPVRNCASEWAQDLADWCDHFDIEFMASLWSMEELEIARKVEMKRAKIAHQIDDDELTNAICSVWKDVFWTTNKDIHGKAFKIFCPGEYPTYPEDFQNELWNRAGYHCGHVNLYTSGYYGYSSHMHGYADALLCVAEGADYIEKHVTMNKADTTLRDNAFALSFEEFGEMVRIGNEMARLR